MTDSLCKICTCNESKYVCPRCNLIYCSVQCYQSRLHLRCSEEFYKESVLEHMTVNENDPEDASKMREILTRLYEEDQDNDASPTDDSLDSDDELDIADRLNSVSLDDADAVWEKLSSSEKQEFVNFLDKGCTENLVPLWEPWWMYRKLKNVVEVVGDKSETEVNYVRNCPSLKPVFHLSDVAKKAPSLCVKWNLINVIGSYAYVLRYLNGDPGDFLFEAVDLILSLSGNLGKNQNFHSYDTGVEGVVQEIFQRPSLDGSERALSTMKDDVQRILHGPEDSNSSFYLEAALSDIINIFELYKTASIHKDPTRSNATNEKSFSQVFKASSSCQVVPRSQVKLALRKIQYYLSWVRACPK